MLSPRVLQGVMSCIFSESEELNILATACYQVQPKKASFRCWCFHVLAHVHFTFQVICRSSMLFGISSAKLMSHIMALKSTKSFQIPCVSESNLCAVTFTLPAYSVSCYVCMAFHMQEEEKTVPKRI